MTLSFLTLFIIAQMAGAIGSSVAAFPGFEAAKALPPEPQQKTISLNLLVKGPDGKPVGGARVNIWHSTVSTGPPDYQDETGVNGLVRFQVLAGKSTQVSIQVKKGDLWGEATWSLSGPVMSRSIELARTNPNIFDRDESRQIQVRFRVQDRDENPLPNANIRCYFTSSRVLQAEGTTTADGPLTVSLLAMNYRIEVNLPGYEPGYALIQLNTSQRVFTPPPVILKKASEAKIGVAVNVTVRNSATRNPVSSAEIILSGRTGITSGIYRGTTDSNGEARIEVGEYGRFDLEISQGFYETHNGELRILQGEQEKNLPPFLLREKPRKKEAAADFVEALVLAGDKRNAPLAGALSLHSFLHIG